MTDQEKIEYLDDRIHVLEQLIASLVLREGAHPPYVQQWRQTVANWPNAGQSVTIAAKELMEWAAARSQG
jgi:hypothetical protein